MIKGSYRILKSIAGQTDERLYKDVSTFLNVHKNDLYEDDARGFCFFVERFANAKRFPLMDDLLAYLPEYKGNPEADDPVIEKGDIPSKLTELLNLSVQSHSAVSISKLSSNALKSSNEGKMDVEQFKKMREILDKQIKESNSLSITMDDFDPIVRADSVHKLLSGSHGLTTGFKAIDNTIESVRPGNVFIIGGYAGDGKTTMALNIFHRNVYELGFNCIYFSLEMSIDEILINLMMRHSRYMVDHGIKVYGEEMELLTNQMRVEDKDHFVDVYLCAYNDFFNNSKGRFYIFEEEGFESNDFNLFRQAIEKIDDIWLGMDDADGKTKNHGVDAVFWDHANLFKFNNTKGASSKNQSVGDSINNFLSNIRNLGHNFRQDSSGKQRYLTNFVLMQLNREARKKAQKDQCGYTLEALAEANEGERCAAYVLTIYSDIATKNEKKAKIQLLKHRFGPVILEPLEISAELENYTLRDLPSGEEISRTTGDMSPDACIASMYGSSSYSFDDQKSFDLS